VFPTAHCRHGAVTACLDPYKCSHLFSDQDRLCIPTLSNIAHSRNVFAKSLCETCHKYSRHEASAACYLCMLPVHAHFRHAAAAACLDPSACSYLCSDQHRLLYVRIPSLFTRSFGETRNKHFFTTCAYLAGGCFFQGGFPMRAAEAHMSGCPAATSRLTRSFHTPASAQSQFL